MAPTSAPSATGTRRRLTTASLWPTILGLPTRKDTWVAPSTSSWGTTRATALTTWDTSYRFLSRWIGPRLWIPLHIGIRVHPLRIALHAIGRHEPPTHWIIPPRVVVIQSRYAVGELAGVALVGAQAALHVALVAVGAVEWSYPIKFLAQVLGFVRWLIHVVDLIWRD